MAGQYGKLVNKQFNSPINLYSENNIRDVLDRESRMLSNGAVGIDFHNPTSNKPTNLQNSAVLRFLEEEEQRKRGGNPTLKRVAWPPPPDAGSHLSEVSLQDLNGPQISSSSQNDPSPTPNSYHQPGTLATSNLPVAPSSPHSPHGGGGYLPPASPSFNAPQQRYSPVPVPASPGVSRRWAPVQAPASPSALQYQQQQPPPFQAQVQPQPQYRPVSPLPYVQQEPTYYQPEPIPAAAPTRPTNWGYQVRDQQAVPVQQYPQQQQQQQQNQHPQQQYQQQQYPQQASPKPIVEPPPSVIRLRPEAPISQAPASVYTSQPATATLKGGKNLRGDLKWPPPETKAQMEVENQARIALARGPVCRPRRVNRDYSNFFAQHALNDAYPRYKVPPGTQFYSLQERGS